MFFSSTGACAVAKFQIANHHSQINEQLYSASFICPIWQQCHSDSEFEALWLIIFCKFRNSKRCWQCYSAATHPGWELNYTFYKCLFSLTMQSSKKVCYCFINILLHKSSVRLRNRRLCWQRSSQNTCFSSDNEGALSVSRLKWASHINVFVPMHTLISPCCTRIQFHNLL